MEYPYIASDSPIFVAGHRGLVGSAIMRRLLELGYNNLLTRSHVELDLLDAAAVTSFFKSARPEYVFLAAAKVGGIKANSTQPAEFLRENLLIQTNVIDAAYRFQVDRLLFLGSSCIYPKHAPQPIAESSLLTGPLEPTNRAYALAKIAGVEMCWSYNLQYGTRYLAAMPANLYGPGDNFDPDTSHVLPALIHKIALAVRDAAEEVQIWGTGMPRRELLYSADMAEACVYLMNLPERVYVSLVRGQEAPTINIGTGKDVTISELAETISRILGFRGRFIFDRSKPDGTPRKVLDVSRIHSLGWSHTTDLESGIASTWQQIRANYFSR